MCKHKTKFNAFLRQEMYKRSLNIPKMITLQGSCTWTTEALSFICCDCAHRAISLSQSSPLSPQPARAIDYLGHCQREIRTGLTDCWLMLNQEKTHMMPAHFKEEVGSCSEKDISPFCAACAHLCQSHPWHGSCPGASSWAQKAFCKGS